MKQFFAILTALVLSVTSFGLVLAQDGPEFAQPDIFKRVTAQVVLRDAADSMATQLITIVSGDRVEILASDGDYVLVNIFTLINNSSSTYEFGGFGWINSDDADLVTVTEIRIIDENCPLDTGGAQAHPTSFVEFGEGWAWSLASAQNCNVLAEGRPLDSDDNTHHYWAVRDLHQSAGTGQYSEDAQVTRYDTNGVIAAIEGTVWLYPVRWNMSLSTDDEDNQPIYLEFAKQKRTAGAEYPIVIHNLRGRTINVSEEMLDGVVPESPDSFEELTPISVTGVRGSNGKIIASVGSNNACWIVIGQTDRDSEIEVERHCGMDEGFAFYNVNETFFWMLPDQSSFEDAAEMAMEEVGYYVFEFIGLNTDVELDVSGFGSYMISQEISFELK